MNKSNLISRISLITGLVLISFQVAGAASTKVLWQIGKTDRNTAEFALAPSAHKQFTHDGFFIVGASDPSKDWPYAQPGPGDAWAGSRSHTYTVVFGMKEGGKSDSCHLIIDLVDTHNAIPPQLEIKINEKVISLYMPMGGSDESINGKPTSGKPYFINLCFASSILKKGQNEVSITSKSGSWILYDALRLEGPDYLKPELMSTFLAIQDIKPSQGAYTQNGMLYRDVTVNVQFAGKPFAGKLVSNGKPLTDINVKQGSQVLNIRVPEDRFHIADRLFPEDVCFFFRRMEIRRIPSGGEDHLIEPRCIQHGGFFQKHCPVFCEIVLCPLRCAGGHGPAFPVCSSILPYITGDSGYNILAHISEMHAGLPPNLHAILMGGCRKTVHVFLRHDLVTHVVGEDVPFIMIVHIRHPVGTCILEDRALEVGHIHLGCPGLCSCQKGRVDVLAGIFKHHHVVIHPPRVAHVEAH